MLLLLVFRQVFGVEELSVADVTLDYVHSFQVPLQLWFGGERTVAFCTQLGFVDIPGMLLQVIVGTVATVAAMRCYHVHGQGPVVLT